jgi:hypothetical protein
MPKDPVAIMLLTAQVNGLNASSLKPWHLEATYQTFDENGQPKDTGTYEEWWANEKKYKASYTRSNYKQTVYATEQDLFSVGDQAVPSPAEQMFPMEVTHPLPTAAAIEQLTFEKRQLAVGNLSLECIEGAQKTSPGRAVTPVMCFGKDLPAIRFKSSGPFRTTYNSIAIFQQHYIAQQIHITDSGKPMLDGKVTLLEIDEQVNDADFVPPSDAIPVPRKIMVSASVIAGNRISATRPEYPAIARAAHVQGTVVLQARISKTGAVG